MLEIDPNQPLIDARRTLQDFMDKRGEIFIDSILQKAVQDTKILMISMALGLDLEKEILTSMQKEINKRLNVTKETQNA